MRISISSRSSVLRGAIAAIFLLLLPTTATADNNGSGSLAKGTELVSEIELLYRSLARVSELLQSADIPADDEIMSSAAKLMRRVRSLRYAAEGQHMKVLNGKEQRIAARQAEFARRREEKREMMQRRMEREGKLDQLRDNKRAALRGGIGSGEIDIEMARQAELEMGEPMMDGDYEEDYEEEGRHLFQAAPEIEGYDELERNLYASTITFPECTERLLDDCLDIISAQLLELQLSAEYIIHAKRNEDQDGYNKVVIITDLTASRVLGKLKDGQVEYPFMWDDAITGYPHKLGVGGWWNCSSKTPEECCAHILAEDPNPDTKGNYLQCHIFVPFGGAGNQKRDDRVIVNLSPDGRVQEPPFIA